MKTYKVTFTYMSDKTIDADYYNRRDGYVEFFDYSIDRVLPVFIFKEEKVLSVELTPSIYRAGKEALSRLRNR